MRSDRKHILILSSWYPTPEQPFLGNFVQRQAVLLSEHCRVTVLHTVPEEHRSERELIVRTNGHLKEIFIYHPKGSHFLSRRNNRLKALSEGLRAIDHPDLIHGHVLIPGGYLFVKAKEFFKCPLIVTEHASYYRPGRKEKLSLKEKYVLQIVRKHADRLISVSEFLRKDMQSLFGDRTIQVIGNPVNTELFRPLEIRRKEPSYFLHISTLDPALKNVDGILEAVSLLVQKGYEEVQLLIISDEPYEEWIEKVNRMGLNRYVKFKGPLTPEELVPHFQQASALVMFSHYETFSIVIAEAWACGTPVISTPVGIAYNMSPELGLSVRDNDPLGLAIAMEKIINDLPFSGMEIRMNAMTYSDHNFLKSILSLYEEFEYPN